MRNIKYQISNVKCVLLVLCLLFVLVTPSHAVFTKLGMAGAQFLKIGVGRCTGMGDAFVAIADDASATYWNPAGICLITQNQVLLNHIDWISDINDEYISYVAPTSVGSFGFAVTALTMGNMEQTTIDEPQGTGLFFSASDFAISASYAHRFTDKFCFGASAKFLQEQIWDMTSTDAAFDFGVYYNTGLRSLRLAMAISNFGPDLKFGGKQLDFEYNPPYDWPMTREPLTGELVTETYPLPVGFRFGAAYDIVSGDKTRLTAAADLVHYNDVNEKVNFGLEGYIYGLTLRAGYVLNTDLSYASDLGYSDGLSAGAGVVVHPFGKASLGVDYGYRNLGRLGPSHRINLTVGF